MEPLPLRPIPLIVAQLEDEARTDEIGTFNRMLAISRSRITGYFYGMPDPFTELARACDQPPSLLAAKSFGETASEICLMCEERRLGHGEGGNGPRTFAPASRRAILAFVEPLSHLAHASNEKEVRILPSHWHGINVRAHAEASEEKLSLSDMDRLEDYFDAHFATKKCADPESRLSRSFPLTWDSYRGAAARALGSRDDLDRALAPFENASSDFMALIRDLVRTCKERADSLEMYLGKMVEIDVTPQSELVAQAFEALYLLFILPYALMQEEPWAA